MTIKQSLFAILDAFPERDVSGWQIFHLLSDETSRNIYPSTLLQYAREYCKLSGATMTPIYHQKSIYHFIPGIKIAGAIKD